MFLFEEYISPISDTEVAGIDPRSDVSPTSTYYALKDLRNQLRAAERNALVDEEGISSLARDWLPLLEQCSKAIKTQSKDIEYLAWFIEALCRIHSFKGLAFGFKVAHNLLDNYFDELYPSLDDDDEVSDKVSALVGLNGSAGEGTLIIPIKSIYLTDSASMESYSFWEYQQGYDISRLTDEKREKKLNLGAVDYELIERSAAETSTEFFVTLKQDIENAIEQFALLSEVMDRVTGQPQPTSNIKQALEVSLAAVEHVAADKLEAAEKAKAALNEVQEVVQSEDDEGQGVALQAVKVNNEINSRESAINKLKEIATFFRKTEPHSPMSYTIEQVIRWSELSLPELLNELITDSDARTGYFKLSGIKISETEI
ncbi:type VI secretion protein ImpA [Pseudoalteromonas carrageenovora]|uniref:Type VI secretion protein ImpA n=1 Tax=Pseudoalteromonas carrageenovora IAM 12662 TaxID=1314868 RepID=A0A2K4XEG0_PSEVC|nr:type VI secretion system protein TssA [Pseudoalteromonas carrageenovora]MBE0384333.1 type VI secretion system protein ImpA [Pseudoalteromonas carrageenovora IAM 12662]QBJ73824.1 type VI secretion protein ImpA [Pseudoalteromonas carrageenovora]GEB71434.1 type VI secretion protein [Pseudoalteromonas carrageenovora]SOU42718.1 Type VI secretion protein ImpA [Pseudoalteromonas carrageenovora IAM 12662]